MRNLRNKSKGLIAKTLALCVCGIALHSRADNNSYREQYERQQNREQENRVRLIRIWLDSRWSTYNSFSGKSCGGLPVLFRSANGGYRTISLQTHGGYLNASTSISSVCHYSFQEGRSKECLLGTCQYYETKLFSELQELQWANGTKAITPVLALYTKNLSTGEVTRRIVGEKRDLTPDGYLDFYNKVKKCYYQEIIDNCNI